MYCGKCGNKLEDGDLFCPECGTRVETATGPSAISNGSGWQIPDKQPGPLGGNSGSFAERLSSALSGGIGNLVPSILGVLMFIWTFLPFINISLGKIGELANMFGEDLSLGNLKFNLYQIKDTINTFLTLDTEGKYRAVSVVITLIVIYVVLVALFAIASGVLNNKKLLMASGVMSTVCLIMWIAYVSVIAYYKRMIFNELEYEFGYPIGGMVGSIHGAGLILLMITLAAHATVSIYKSVKA